MEGVAATPAILPVGVELAAALVDDAFVFAPAVSLFGAMAAPSPLFFAALTWLVLAFLDFITNPLFWITRFIKMLTIQKGAAAASGKLQPN
jgi:hypothetical protein